MEAYHILIVIISSVIPDNLVLLTKSEQSGPKSRGGGGLPFETDGDARRKF